MLQKNLKLIKNQNGMGLVSVLIAAGLLLVIAVAVSSFLTGFNKQNIRTENTSDCQNIAKTVTEYLQKDDNQIYMTSVGPVGTGATPNNFPTGSTYVNEDGVQRFSFLAGGTPAYSVLALPLSLTPRSLTDYSSVIPDKAHFYNYLNIRDSFNRLLAMAANQHRCCTDIDNCPSVSSHVFYDSTLTTNPSGLKFAQMSTPFKVYLAINPTQGNATLCSGAGNTLQPIPAGLPDPHQSDIKIQYELKVVMNPNSPNLATQCRATNAVQFFKDIIPPIAVLSMDTTGLCAPSKKLTPSFCGGNINTFKFKFKTVLDDSKAAIPKCVPCLRSLSAYKCAPAGADDAVTACVNTGKCVGSDPGSLFLCRIAEKKWFYTPANYDQWEPCSAAKVRDTLHPNGQPNARVVIDYNTSATGNPAIQQSSTEANITVSNLITQEAYVVDVRAVDTGGTLASAPFCSYSGNCTLYPNASNPISSPAQFVVSSGPPITGAVTDLTNIIGHATDVATTRPNPAGPYNNALNSFGASNFQCREGTVGFSAKYSYIGVNAPLGIEVVNGIMNQSAPIGAPVPYPATGTTTCDISNSDCELGGISTSGHTDGQWQMTMAVGNECWAATATSNFNWCQDTNANFNTSYMTIPTAVAGDSMLDPMSTSFPSGTGTGVVVVGPVGAQKKLCGVSFACPHLTALGAPDAPTPTAYQYAVSSPSPTSFYKDLCYSKLNWMQKVDSGCTANSTGAPGSQHCLAAFDPCGRQANSKFATYSTTLAPSYPSPYTPTTNHCGGGLPGNACDSGSYCRSDKLCATSCSYKNAFCVTNSTCQDSSDCGALHGTCALSKCNCPVNNTCGAAPTAKPCVDLNSCGVAAPPANACGWIAQAPTACIGGDPCNCANAPSFTTPGTYNVPYVCQDLATGGPCAGSCAGANPSVTNVACTNFCPLPTQCGPNSNPGYGGGSACHINNTGAYSVICNWPTWPPNTCVVLQGGCGLSGCHYGCP